ncbi:MAG: transglutaminase domain-containing protein [Bacteroidaceae bacterium]|nr:transglutaminase domain-containing protein [Bacteroidaceae bacterium]
MMKRFINAFIMLLFAANIFAQSDVFYIKLKNEQVVKYAVDEIYNMGFLQPEFSGFPEADNSKNLAWVNPVERPKVLLEAAGRDCGKNLYEQKIEDNQYDEIATFTRDLVKDCSKEYDKYKTVFDWIVKNIKYVHSDNRPYSVFTSRQGICQGYADLLTVMLNTIDIPCVTANGFIPEGGHAWNYVNADDVWYLSDPTNNRMYNLSETSKYTDFNCLAIQATLFEDEFCTYNYYNQTFNVESIKSGNPVVTIPFSVNGIKISSVSPSKPGSTVLKELYLGKNIESLDFGNSFGIAVNYQSVETIEVDPENETLSSYSNIVYKGNGTEMYMVAPGAKLVKVNMSLDKESRLKDLMSLECVVFENGVTSISAYAVERCPNLKVAYVPENADVAEGAFSGVHSDFEIVRGEYPGK